MTPRVDILVPVHNSLHMVRPCLESVRRFTDLSVDQVTVLDDGSDSHTAAELDSIGEAAGFIVKHAARNQGFVRNCNWGMEESTAELLILLNSDTMVSPGWVDRFVAAFASDPAIGIASPISNFAPHMRIEMVPGMSHLDMQEVLDQAGPPQYPDITTPEGFCFGVSRACMAAIGYFDLVFDDGYGEESDYCMRAKHAGFRTVCIDDAYIYHRGRASFGVDRRDALMERNRQIFLARWRNRYAEDFEAMKAQDPIGARRALFRELPANTGAQSARRP